MTPRPAGLPPPAVVARSAPAPTADGRPSAWRRHLPFAVWALLALAVVYTLEHAKAFLFPIALTGLLGLILSPIVQGLRRFRITPPVGAALVLAALLAGTAWGGYVLSTPAAEWMARAPES